MQPHQEGTESLPVKVIGIPGCSAAYSIRDFLHRSDVPFEWVVLKDDQEASKLGVDGLGDARLPLTVFPDGTRLERPTIRQITEKLGWFHNPKLGEYDLAIYGGGPAGLSAAVYGASEGLKTVLIEKNALGGQAGSSSKIENYLGFPRGISGAELADRAREQAYKFGAELLIAREGVRGEFATGKGVGTLADGTKIIARATICATGINYRKLDLPNEAEFSGQGVYYGAGSSEAALCKDQHVIVVGGGNSAGQAAMHFSKYASQVTIVVRRDTLKETLSTYLVDRVSSAPNITVLTNSMVTALEGSRVPEGRSRVLEAITVRNRLTNADQQIRTKWLFLCIGGAPRTEWAAEAGIARDSDGYLVTGPDLTPYLAKAVSWPLNRAPYFLETNVPGMFAAGDVRHGSIKRCASAVGEGAMAVAFVHRYLATG
jgi:thioredoxin reductase (NADPH)